MKIALQNLRPLFLSEEAIARSKVWGEGLELRPKERIGVVAPSGKGKTLLIQILYGLCRDYGGTVHLETRDIRSLDDQEWTGLRQDQLSIVFQDLRLFPHLTGRDNIEVKSCLTGTLPPEVMMQQAKRLGVDAALDRLCGILSLGEQQRIAVLRALVQPFDWLLLDEPFSHLDRTAAEAVSALILEVCDARSAGLVITSLGPVAPLSVDRELLL